MIAIHLRKSPIAGRGIFATRDFKKGEFIATLRGKVHIRHYRKKSDYRNEQTWIPIGLHRWVEPTFPFKYVNHSCEPTIGFRTPRRAYAVRDIKKDEELTIDYSTIEYTDFWSIPCHCGAKTCRGTIQAVQYLDPKTYRSHLPYIPRFLQNFYLQAHRALS